MPHKSTIIPHNKLSFYILSTMLVLGVNLSINRRCTAQESTKTIRSNHLNVTQKNVATNEYIKFYQKYISGIRGQECPMYPSCSYYGLKTFSETNFAEAFILTSDRLMRCGHDHGNYQLTLQKNGFKLLDFPPYTTPPKDLIYEGNTYAFAYSDTNPDPENLTFIKKLINQGYYQEALLEIMRTEFLLDDFDIEIFINKVICLKALEEYENAIFEYETKCPIEYKQNPELLFQLASINYKLENFKQSFELDTMALSHSQNKFETAKLLSMKGLINAHQYKWNDSREDFGLLSDFPSHSTIAQSSISILNETDRFKYKSPTFAGIISVIPGVGYAYSGHKQTAISAFLINGLLTYATYTSFKSENYGVGILTGIFNLSFYIGNIQGASKSATRYNNNLKKQIIDRLESINNF